jgi:hypothetical protein
MSLPGGWLALAQPNLWHIPHAFGASFTVEVKTVVTAVAQPGAGLSATVTM